MDTLLKSLLQVLNPNVETGPGRIVSQHPYDDGIMPDYPAERATDDGGDGRPAVYDDAPTADYLDGGVVSADAVPENPVSRSAGGEGDSSAVADPGARPMADFIVSLLKTVQLTPRAALKKSRDKLRAAAPAPDPGKPSTTPTAPKPVKLS